MKKIYCFGIILLINLTCGKTVKRLIKDSDVYDLSGNWSHVDYVETSKELAKELKHSNWVHKYQKEHNEMPRVIVDEVITKIMSKMINPEDLSSQIEISLTEEFADSMKIMAGGAFRNRIRHERMAQQYNASESSKAKMANEIGANIMITTTITEDNDYREGGFLRKQQEFRVYKVILKVINVETTELLWSKVISMKKHIKG